MIYVNLISESYSYDSIEEVRLLVRASPGALFFLFSLRNANLYNLENLVFDNILVEHFI